MPFREKAEAMQGIPGSTTEETSAPPPDTNTSSASENNLNGAAANGSSAVSNPPPAVPAAAAVKPKKKRANPVYITPIRRERKRSCSDSDNEDGITGDDSAWGPGGKRKKGKGGKKKAGAGRGKKKGKKGSDSDWVVWAATKPLSLIRC